MKKIIFILGLCFLFGCTVGQNKVVKSNINWLYDMEAAKQIALDQDKPIMIDFYADWCSWCKKMDADTYANKKVSDKSEEFVCVKIDSDANQALAKEYKVRGLPTTVFLNSNAEKLEALPGYMSADKFLSVMQDMLARSNE